MKSTLAPRAVWFACLAVGTWIVVADRAATANDAETPAPKTPAAKQSDKQQASPPKRIAQGKDDAVVLRARDVVVHGKRVRYEVDKNTIGYWTDASDWVSWDLKIERPGKFNVVVEQGCGKDSGGSEYTIDIADQKVSDRVQDTGSFAIFHLRDLGPISIEKPGDYALSVKPTSKPGVAVMDLRTIWLKPVKADGTALLPAKPNAGDAPLAKPADESKGGKLPADGSK